MGVVIADAKCDACGLVESFYVGEDYNEGTVFDEMTCDYCGTTTKHEVQNIIVLDETDTIEDEK